MYKLQAISHSDNGNSKPSALILAMQFFRGKLPIGLLAAYTDFVTVHPLQIR
jgi:hypothetical protein